MSVTATVAADASGTLVNEATISGDGGDPNPSNHTAQSTVTLTPLVEPAPEAGAAADLRPGGYQARQSRTAHIRQMLS